MKKIQERKDAAIDRMNLYHAPVPALDEDSDVYHTLAEADIQIYANDRIQELWIANPKLTEDELQENWKELYYHETQYSREAALESVQYSIQMEIEQKQAKLDNLEVQLGTEKQKNNKAKYYLANLTKK